MMKQMTRRKFRERVAKLYWEAHGDGQVSAEHGTDFGRAAITIEAVVIEYFGLERKPRQKKKGAAR